MQSVHCTQFECGALWQSIKLSFHKCRTLWPVELSFRECRAQGGSPLSEPISLSAKPPDIPSSSPSESVEPSVSPSNVPSLSARPYCIPSSSPSKSSMPSTKPSVSAKPSGSPSSSPSNSVVPSGSPSTVTHPPPGASLSHHTCDYSRVSSNGRSPAAKTSWIAYLWSCSKTRVYYLAQKNDRNSERRAFPFYRGTLTCSP